jgi:transcriptional regulator with PAS, ATPase and Fis domain
MKNYLPQLGTKGNSFEGIAIYSHGGITYANDEFKKMRRKLNKADNNFLEILSDLISRLAVSNEGSIQKKMPLGGDQDELIITACRIDKSRRGDEALLFINPKDKDADDFPFFNPGQTIDFENSPIMKLSSAFSMLIGEDIQFKAVLLKAQKAAQSDYPILIKGESGTGKEILAKTIHLTSRRRHNKFVDINCAAIPDQLIDSELFGYEKGAFTGALPGGRPGLFEESNFGTLFLDEIADASLSTQAKLLRVLNEGQFKRVGSSKNHKVDVRIISATNKDLTEMIKDKHFRQDLNYRLNTITINLPPLRKRPGDISLLAKYFLKEHSTKNSRNLSFSTNVLEYLNSYHWPGNVRELKGVIDYMVTMATGSTIKATHFPDFMLSQNGFHLDSECQDDEIPVLDNIDLLSKAVEAAEKKIILEVLGKSKNKSNAITMLGTSRRTFYLKLRKYKIS